MTSPLRVESSIAGRADVHPFRVGATACFAATLFLRDGWQCVCFQLVGVEDAVARPAPASERFDERDLPFHLVSSSFLHVALHWCLLVQLSVQQPSAQHLEAVAPAGAVDDLRDPVQGFCVAVRNRVVEVRQHLLAPVPGGREQRHEALLALAHVGRHGLPPGVEALSSFGAARRVVDVVERLLQPVGGCHVRLVIQPHLEIESTLLVEVLVAHPEQRLPPHPVPAHSLLLVLGQRDSDVVHRAVGHSDQVELVDNDRQPRENGLRGILVWLPHVDSEALDAAALLELMQPRSHERLVAVGQHVDWNPVDDVGDDAPELAVNLRLVDAQPFWQPGLVLSVQALDVVAGQCADGLVITADVLSDASEGVSQTLLLDVLDATSRHARRRVDAAQRLDERAAALAASEALGVGLDAHRTAPNRAISKNDHFGAVLINAANYAAFLACIRQNCVVGRDDVFIAFTANAGWLPPRQVKDVGHKTSLARTFKTPPLFSCSRFTWALRRASSFLRMTMRSFNSDTLRCASR